MRIAVFRVKRYYYVFSMGTVTLDDKGTRAAVGEQ
jgi:hypothetical protein